MPRFCKSLKRISLLLVILTLALGIHPTSLHAGGCEDAFIRCALDPVTQAFFAGGLYCGVGYLFCKKYIG